MHFVRLHGGSGRGRGLHRLHGANHKRRGTDLQGRSGLGEVHKRFFKPGFVSNLRDDIQRIASCTGGLHIRYFVGEHQHIKRYGEIFAKNMVAWVSAKMMMMMLQLKFVWFVPPRRDCCAKMLLNDVVKSVWFLCAYPGLLWFLYAATIYSPWQKYNDTRDPGNNDKQKIMTLDEFLVFAKNASGVGIYINIQVIHLEFSLE